MINTSPWVGCRAYEPDLLSASNPNKSLSLCVCVWQEAIDDANQSVCL